MLVRSEPKPKESESPDPLPRRSARRSGYAEARRLVVVLLDAPPAASVTELRARRQLLQIAIRLAAATLEPQRRLLAPRLLGFLQTLDELEESGRIDHDLATALWRHGAELHDTLRRR